jgi:thioesterase domain-containing protein
MAASVDAPGVDGSAAAPARRFQYLVPMHQGAGGFNLPFFLVAGMFGNVLNLRHLANQIGTDREFYGIQARGLFGGQEPHESFEEMARDYLVEVRSVQPHGPYLFGGFSGGGYVAIEMARQLAAEGEETALVVLLDTPVPDPGQMTAIEKARLHLQNLRKAPLRYPFDFVRNRVRWTIESSRRRRGLIDHSAEGALHSTEIEAAFYRAIERYDLQHVDHQLTLFRPKLNPTHVFSGDRQINGERRFLTYDNGWGAFADHVEVNEVPGNHDSMVLEPNVRVLAGRLRAKIIEAERAALSLAKR